MLLGMLTYGVFLAVSLSGLALYYLLSRVRVCGRGGAGAKRSGHAGERYPPIARVIAEPALVQYDLREMSSPPATGLRFKLLIRFAFSRLGQWLFVSHLKKTNNLYRMSNIYLPEKPTLFPTPLYPPPMPDDYTQTNSAILQRLLDKVAPPDAREDQQKGFRFPTVADYRRAYEAGRCTPTDVANAALRAIELSNAREPPLRGIVETNRNVVLAMAEASTERWNTGRTLSLLDGIPVSIKGMFRVEPYECFAGCARVPQVVQGIPEAAITRKLKESGAIIIGIANLQEFGTGTLGSNPNHRHLTARNPYNTQCYPGGSSSGSAVCVAAGLCPISIGTDGGGSVRIPAAICGVVGLKPTFGLIDLSGCSPVSQSVGAPGPLCSSVLDTAIAMDVIAKETDGDRTLMSLEGLDEGDLDRVRVGVYWDYFNHAEKEIVDKCKAALSVLKSLGAEIVDIKIPELENARVAHVVSITSEMSQALAIDTDEYFSDINLETLIVVCGGMGMTAYDYLNAQKQRTRALASLGHIFEQVDVIVTPSTACVAPTIHPDVLPVGESNAKVSGRLMRFAFLANLCGNPGLALPVGYSEAGLPVSLQLMGRFYEERLLLRIGLALESSGHFPLQKPQVFYDLLKN